MKKIICALMSMIMLASFAPGYVAFAEEQPISIDSITVNLPDRTANIEGSVTVGSGERTVTLRVLEKDTVLSDIKKENIQNIAQIETDRNGKFSYRFEISFDNSIAETYDVYATNGITGDTCLKSFSAISYTELLENSVVMYANNRNAVCYGERIVLDSAPYIKDGKAYLDSAEVNKLFGTAFSGEVDLSSIENNYVYIDDSVIAVSKKEIAANVGSLYRDFGIYVSNSGDDENNGSFESPVKTLERALELSDDYKGFDGTRIYIEDGSYNNGRSIDIKNKKNISIESYAGGKATFNGRIKLSADDFHKTTDEAVLARVGERAKEKLVSLDLSDYISGALNKAADNPDSYYRLYANGARQTLARYPDTEYEIAQGVDNTDMCTFPNNDRIKSWVTKDAYVVLFNDTYTMYKRGITSFDNGGFTIKQWSPKNKLAAAVNILEELTVPGEWYIDNETKMLYYYPERGLSDMELTVGNYNVFNISGSENITIKNIGVEKANRTGINVTGSRGVVIDGVKATALGNLGISVTSSRDSVVKNCEISDINNGGVNISGGDIPSLTPGNNIVENCHIYDFSQETTGSGGVTLSGMGNIVRNNVIHDSTSQGVLFQHTSNGMIVENNEIYNVVRGLYDAGAVYGINLLENTGIQIKNNYIHDLTKSYMNWGGVYAIYEDNGSSGITVSGNIISDSMSAGLVGGGRDNTWTNNLFVDCSVGAYDTRMKLGGWIRGNENLKVNVVSKEGYDEEKWKATYPFWEGLLNDIAKEKEYLDTKTLDENGNEVYDEAKYFDAGNPWNVTITNNLTIADKKSFAMNPIGLWWNPETAGYNTTYEGNVSVMGTTYQKASLSGEKAHSGKNAMKYEIIQPTNTAIKKKISDDAKPGEMYRISAWIFAERVNDVAKVKISTDRNPQNLSYYADFPYNIDGSGEVNVPEGEWIRVYCYWVSNNNNNSAVITFPKCSVGDVFYIDDVKAERVMYSDQLLPSPNLNDVNDDTEYKYAPSVLDLSETKTALNIGDETPIKASNITAKTSDNDGDGKISANELSFAASNAEIASAVSDNTEVAELADGKIKALSSGKATITVTDTAGNTASMNVIVAPSNGSIFRFNGTSGYVKDSDPVYGGEAVRPYSAAETKSGITVRDGVVAGFKVFDPGVSKNDKTGYVKFGFNLGKLPISYSIDDKWYTGQYEIYPGLTRKPRTGGWRQLVMEIKENSDGKLVMTWYCDGQRLNSAVDYAKEGDEISFTAVGSLSSLPTYIKDAYIITPEQGKNNDGSGGQSFEIDDFENETLSWTTDQVSKLDQILKGNTGKATDEFASWFADFDGRDFAQTDALFKFMPQFQRIEFADIGNKITVLENELEPPVERLAEVNSSDKTVKLVWNNVSGASAYSLVISRNADMTDVVYKNRLDTNTDTAWIPENGTYYYTVTSINLSKNYKSEARSEVYSFTVSGGISLDSCTAEEKDGRYTVSFIFNSSEKALSGKAILAEKDKDGKLVNAVFTDIPSAVDGKITISGECAENNNLECYLWNGVEGMMPYCAKATYSK